MLSGGFKLRVLLAQVLAADPDVLLLDEPTNHLDILSIRWLEKFLIAYKGCAVVISHDHRFLDNVSTHILDVDYETIMLYHGNYTQFEEQKAAERDRKEHEIEKREGEIAKHKEFVDRFKAKATKARQAQSKVKMIEKIVIEEPAADVAALSDLQVHASAGRRDARCSSSKASRKSYGDNQVLNDVSLRVQRGDRLAILGPNGIGKSTLLKIAMGVVEPDDGKVEWGYETWPGYFAQDHRELVDASEQSVEAWLWEIVPSRDDRLRARQARRGALPRRRRLQAGARPLRRRGRAPRDRQALGRRSPTSWCSTSRPTISTSRRSRRSSRASRPTTARILFVSHDRWFVCRLANRILEITHNGIRDFEGSYDDYLARCGDDHLDADVVLARARQEKKQGGREEGRRARDAGAGEARSRRSPSAATS